MIIGTIALISILLGGGTFNTFIFEDLDKYAKKVVVEDDRKEYVLAELKTAKKSIKEYYKERKKIIKSLKELNLDRNADRDDFKSLGNDLRMNRDEIDQYIVNSRLMVIKKINDDEWEKIMQMSEEDAQNQKAKEEEKELKGKIKDVFEKTESTVVKSIDNPERTDNVLKSLEKFRASYYQLESNIIDNYPEDNLILTDKNSGKEELNLIYSEVFKLRESFLLAATDFHFEVLDQTNEKEWGKIMKEMNKIIQ